MSDAPSDLKTVLDDVATARSPRAVSLDGPTMILPGMYRLRRGDHPAGQVLGAWRADLALATIQQEALASVTALQAGGEDRVGDVLATLWAPQDRPSLLYRRGVTEAVEVACPSVLDRLRPYALRRGTSIEGEVLQTWDVPRGIDGPPPALDTICLEARRRAAQAQAAIGPAVTGPIATLWTPQQTAIRRYDRDPTGALHVVTLDPDDPAAYYTLRHGEHLTGSIIDRRASDRLAVEVAPWAAAAAQASFGRGGKLATLWSPTGIKLGRWERLGDVIQSDVDGGRPIRREVRFFLRDGQDPNGTLLRTVTLTLDGPDTPTDGELHLQATQMVVDLFDQPHGKGLRGRRCTLWGSGGQQVASWPPQPEAPPANEDGPFQLRAGRLPSGKLLGHWTEPVRSFETYAPLMEAAATLWYHGEPLQRFRWNADGEFVVEEWRETGCYRLNVPSIVTARTEAKRLLSKMSIGGGRDGYEADVELLAQALQAWRAPSTPLGLAIGGNSREVPPVYFGFADEPKGDA